MSTAAQGQWRVAGAAAPAEVALRALDQAREGVIVTDARQRIVYVNRTFCALTGYAAEEVLGRTPALLKSGRHSPRFYRRLWQALRRDGRWQGQVWNRRRDGTVYPEWLSVSALTDPGGRVTHYVGTFADLTAERQREAELARLARQDLVTGLASRMAFRTALARALAGGGGAAVLFVRLSGLDPALALAGETGGDAVLREAGWRIRRLLRGQGLARARDCVARHDGAAFTVLLAGTPGAAEALAVARRGC